MNSMNARILAGSLMLFAGIVFLVIGFRSQPQNTTYIVLGVVFAILAAARLRRAKAP
jgi:drug/metabolite transporter (DMT)-like permease